MKWFAAKVLIRLVHCVGVEGSRTTCLNRKCAMEMKVNRPLAFNPVMQLDQQHLTSLSGYVKSLFNLDLRLTPHSSYSLGWSVRNIH